ncbi:aquaporin-12-like isoform X1 [Castor canadensis]|uniref:Aquaporin-12-like isoform X1 n=1 Tax=Castor canadensis TaxID=51338 RepID=A0AC58MFX3_CASCN
MTSGAGREGPRCGVPRGQVDSPTSPLPSDCGASQPPTRHQVPVQHGSFVEPRVMAGLNVSLSFFFATCALCEAARRASKALLPTGAYVSFAREAAAAAQLAACYLEMQVLVEIGPWAGGFGPDLLLTLVFLLFLVHGATFDGASANPAVALQEFLMAEESLLSTLLKLVAQGLGVQTACALTQRCWALELSDMHLLQSLMFTHCSSALRTSVLHGALVEGACAFFFHLTLLHLRHSLPVYRVPALALLVTMMAYTDPGRWKGSGGLNLGCWTLHSAWKISTCSRWALHICLFQSCPGCLYHLPLLRAHLAGVRPGVLARPFDRETCSTGRRTSTEHPEGSWPQVLWTPTCPQRDAVARSQGGAGWQLLGSS